MTRSEKALIRAALNWWIAHRPILWSERDHRKNSTVNAVTKSEQELAWAVARVVNDRTLDGSRKKAIGKMSAKRAIIALIDTLENGVVYNKETRKYELVWTKRQLAAGRRRAAMLHKKLNIEGVRAKELKL